MPDGQRLSDNVLREDRGKILSESYTRPNMQDSGIAGLRIEGGSTAYVITPRLPWPAMVSMEG